jgi:hypothetical protein
MNIFITPCLHIHNRFLLPGLQAIQKEIEGRNKQLVADVLQKCIEKNMLVPSSSGNCWPSETEKN